MILVGSFHLSVLYLCMKAEFIPMRHKLHRDAGLRKKKLYGLLSTLSLQLLC